MKILRRYLLAGLVVWLPILLTMFILRFIIQLLDQSIALLPNKYQPGLPGFGVVFSFIVLLITGVAATNFIGQRLVRWSELCLDKIPLVRSIYNSSKKLINALFSNNSQAFRKAVLVEYPRKGLWTIAFQTGSAVPEVEKHVGSDLISIFVPTTPNPTGGYLIMLPRSEVIELELSVDAALKLVISLGVMQPTAKA